MNKGHGAFFGFTFAGLALVASSCGTPPRYPAELMGGHSATGRHFCEYTIDGHNDVLSEYAPSIHIWGNNADNDCEEIFLEARPNPSYGMCARVVEDSATTWRATVRQSVYLPDPTVGAYFYSADRGVTWQLENIPYTGTLTYNKASRMLTLEVQGTGVTGRSSTYQGTGTVHCVYDAMVD